ncbi:MAG: hypothetical protein ACLRZH_06260 [Ruthenibacterium lactatiformans]
MLYAAVFGQGRARWVHMWVTRWTRRCAFGVRGQERPMISARIMAAPGRAGRGIPGGHGAV